jgi:hypothetical protein
VVTDGDIKRNDLFAGMNRSTVTFPLIAPDTGATRAVFVMLVDRKVSFPLVLSVPPSIASVPVIYSLLLVYLLK